MSIKHTAFSTLVQDTISTMLKSLFDAQIKIIKFCRKHTTFTFPAGDWVKHLLKNNMFVPFTPMGASGAFKYSVKVSMFVEASYFCSVSQEVVFMSF